MANPPQIDQKAVIVVSGQEFSFWTAVSCERTYQVIPSTVTLQTYESSPGGLPGGWTTVHLMLGQPAECYLAGQLALTGIIDVRQVLYSKGTHEVTIRVGCLVTSMQASTVYPKIDGTGGQFVGQRYQQIAQAIGKNVQVNTEVQKAIGAEIPFDNRSIPLRRMANPPQIPCM
jgi:prophage tail gpP-like protein